MGASGNVAEVFRSWQGEGLLLGRRMVFVRLAGCTVDCRYCDTAWAFDVPASVAVPGRPSGKGAERLENPLTVEQVVSLVDAADPDGESPVSLTGGEPLEQAEFTAALCAALSDRELLLETAGLHGEALARVAPLVSWIACDLKLPSSTGQPDVLELHAAVLGGGALGEAGVFFKLVVDGDTTEEEVDRAGALAAACRPGAPAFLQPVTPLGGSPALPRQRLDALADALMAHDLDVRVVPQVHKVLGVR